MALQSDDIHEEVEEIRELLYDILKDFPTGITSSFLEDQYKKRFVVDGIARPLPVEWMDYIKLAEEFEVKQVSPTITMLYIVNTKSGDCQPNWPSLVDPEIPDPSQNFTQETNGNELNQGGVDVDKIREQQVDIVEFDVDQLDAIALHSLPSERTEVQVISAMDPDEINIQLNIWTPMLEYLRSALARHITSPLKSSPEPNLRSGSIFCAEINGKVERVEIVRPSQKGIDSGYWVVHAIDAGFFHIVHNSELRPLTEAVAAFKKILLAKCKIFGVRGTCETNKQEMKWSREAQHFIHQVLCNNPNYRKIEIVPKSEWSYDQQSRRKIPQIIAQLLIDGSDLSEQLVSMGLAEKEIVE